MTPPVPAAEPRPDPLPRNFALNVLDGVCFSAATAFFSHAGLVPLYVTTLTDARWPIGLITPVLMLGIALPQLLGAAFAAAQTDFWRAIRAVALLPRLWVLLLAGVPFVPAPWTLPCFFFVWAAYALALGFCIPIWTTCIAEVIPAAVRGRFFGTRTAAGGVMAVAGTGIAGWVLASYPGRTGFAACFAVAALLLFCSLLAFYATRHDWAPFNAARATRAAEAPGGFWRDALATVRENAAFRRYLLARIGMTATVAAMGFYAVHAVQAFHLTVAEGSLLSLAIVFVPNLTAALWGTLADRLGNRQVQVPLVAAAALANVALAMTPPLAAYVACLVVAGFVGVANQLFDNKTMMELDQTRCGTLVGALNLALTPCLFVLPIGAGVLAELVGVPAVFLATGVCLAAAALVLALERAPRVAPAP